MYKNDLIPVLFSIYSSSCKVFNCYFTNILCSRLHCKCQMISNVWKQRENKHRNIFKLWRRKCLWHIFHDQEMDSINYISKFRINKTGFISLCVLFKTTSDPCQCHFIYNKMVVSISWTEKHLSIGSTLILNLLMYENVMKIKFLLLVFDLASGRKFWFHNMVDSVMP